jgi:hypothetical protein
MVSLKKKQLRKKRLARKKAKEARVKDIKAIEAELAKSVKEFEENAHPLESPQNKRINERKGHCQRKGHCRRKGCGRPLRKVSTPTLRTLLSHVPLCFWLSSPPLLRSLAIYLLLNVPPPLGSWNILLQK